MSGSARIWFVACARGAPPREFAARIRSLAESPHVGWRIADHPEFVSAFELSGEWRMGAGQDLDELLEERADRASEAVWLADPEHVARRIAAALALAEAEARRLLPRAFSLTALDHAPGADASNRPSLAGFELDWLPPRGGGGGFPGAAPRR